MIGRAAVALAAALFLCPGPGIAHPHVWIDVGVTVETDRAGVSGVRLTWRFDETYGEHVIARHRRGPEKSFTAAEVERVRRDNFARTSEVGYFTRIEVDGRVVVTGEASGFEAVIDAGRLRYGFTLPVRAVVASELTITLVDPEFFIDFAIPRLAPILVTGPLADRLDCRRRPSPEIETKWGGQYPAVVRCQPR